jgi:hypothetical protein
MNRSTFRIGRRGVALACILASIAMLPGCAGKRLHAPPDVPGPFRSESLDPASLRRIAVLVVPAEAHVSTGGFTPGKGVGAAQGAGVATVEYLGAFLDADCGGGFVCAMVAAFAIVTVPIVAVGGAIAGASSRVSKGDVAAMNALLEEMTSDAGMARRLAAELPMSVGPTEIVLVEPGTTVDDLAPDRFDAVLELHPAVIRGFGTTGSGNPPIRWIVELTPRLLAVEDGDELFVGTYVHVGPARKLAAWISEDGGPLRRELERARTNLREAILDGMLFVEPIPVHADTPSDGFRFFGPAPVSPALDPPGDRVRRNDRVELDWPRVRSGRPTLVWQDLSTELDPEIDVTYELRIAREDRGAPAERVYARSNLAEHVHAIEVALDPGRYFWTVRGVFVRPDGSRRVTHWGAVHGSSRSLAGSPSRWSYRFQVQP